jgi:hypothetical protein
MMIAGFALILLLIGFIYLKPYLWLRANSGVVSIDGVNPTSFEVYHSPRGEILLRNPTPYGYEDYIISKERKELGIPNNGNFISLLFCVFSKEISPPVVASTNQEKIGREMAVDFQRDWVEFTTTDGKRLKIDF